jgi:hypothetical protein
MRGSAILMAFWGVVTLLWVLSATLWKAETLKRFPPGGAASFWLRVLRIPETEPNRARLLNVGALVGIAFDRRIRRR